jgi:hypothetical protein
MTYHLGPDATFNQDESLRGQPSRNFIKANLSPEQGKHWSIPLPFRALFINLYVMLLFVHLHLGVKWNPRFALWSFHVTLFAHVKQCHERMTMLRKIG